MSVDPALWPLLEAAQAAEARDAWIEAAALYGEAIQRRPDDHRLHCNRANLLWLADQPRPALEGFERALALAPDQALPWRGLGNAARDLNHFGRAAGAYGRSSLLQPDPLTDWNRSQVLIGLQRHREAAALAERRLELEALAPHRSGVGWDGQSASLQRGQRAGVPLQVWSEQGFGDTLQHLRWLDPLSAMLGPDGPPVQLLVEPALVRLLQRGLGWLPRPVQVIAKGEEAPAPDGWEQHHISLQSLPARLAAGGLADPRRCGGGPWLQLPRQTQPAGAGPRRVGVLWAAGRKMSDGFTRREYAKRSLPAAALGTLLEGLTARGAAVMALQHGADRERVAPWRGLLAEELAADADFLATAERLLALDLVITVDTALAHLAGCLGRPTWVLLPWSADPRWLRQRPDSPWYPSLRLFRQPQGGAWPEAVAELLEAFSAPAPSC